MHSKDDWVSDNGRYTTIGLFRELWCGENPVFTLQDRHKVVDGVEYLSLKQLYLEMGDVHEYTFASTYLLGWKHWQALCDSPKLRDHIAAWRTELEIKLRSEAMEQMKALASSGDKVAVKYIADKGWEGQVKRGRPSKAEVEKEKKLLARASLETKSDYERIMQ